MIDDVGMLIGEQRTTYDKYGNEIVDPAERTVMCRISSVTRSEFYSAATAGLQPELTVILSDAEDYRGETLVRYPGVDGGQLYSVIRTYRGGRTAGPDGIELILTRKVGKP